MLAVLGVQVGRRILAPQQEPEGSLRANAFHGSSVPVHHSPVPNRRRRFTFGDRSGGCRRDHPGMATPVGLQYSIVRYHSAHMA